MYQLLFSYLNTALCAWTIAFLMPLILLEVTNSPIYVSAAYAVGMLPYVVVTPIAGVLGDSVNKQRMIQIGELVSAIFVIVLTFVPFKAAHAPLLLGLHFILSSTIALHHPAFQAMTPSVVNKEKISHFNAYVSTIDNLIGISAPALIGLLLAVGTKKALLYGTALVYLLSFGIISWLPYHPPSNAAPLSLKTIPKSITDGFRYIWSTYFIKYAMLMFVGTNFGIQFFYASFMYHLKNDYLVPEEQLSYYLIPSGISAIIGALIAPRIIKRFAGGKIITWVTALQGCIVLLITLSQHSWITAGLWGLTGGLAAVTIVTFFTLRQKIVPAHLLSRTVAFTRMVAYLAIPAGAISGGIVFERTNNFVWIAAISGSIILLTALAFWRRLPRHLTRCRLKEE